jgi:hypothetical protein
MLCGGVSYCIARIYILFYFIEQRSIMENYSRTHTTRINTSMKESKQKRKFENSNVEQERNGTEIENDGTCENDLEEASNSEKAKREKSRKEN